MASLTPEQSYLIQSHALVECLVHLGELEMRGECDKTITLCDDVFGNTARLVKSKLSHISIFQGQGVLLTTFYLFLLLPHEWTKRNTQSGIDINLHEPEKKAKELVTVCECTYKKKGSVLTHFRNALAHGRVSWDDESFVFSDENKNGERFSAKISMSDLGILAQSLNEAIAQHIASLR